MDKEMMQEVACKEVDYEEADYKEVDSKEAVVIEKGEEVKIGDIKKILFLVLLIICSILILSILIIPLLFSARETGEKIGHVAGTSAGLAVGSFYGVTQGLEEGYDAGKIQGLSAEDTNAAIANEMTTIGKLNVLVAEDQMIDDFSQGKDYKALFVYTTKATFSVNLDEAEIIVENDGVEIILPQIEVDFVIDENESEKLVEWQKNFWSGSTEAGYLGYMNSMKMIKNTAATEMTNYEELMEQAMESAKKQVEILVDSVLVDKKRTTIRFKGEVE